jgi:hypothetical protein
VHRGGWTFKDAAPAASKALHEAMMMKTHLASGGGTSNVANEFKGGGQASKADDGVIGTYTDYDV